MARARVTEPMDGVFGDGEDTWADAEKLSGDNGTRIRFSGIGSTITGKFLGTVPMPTNEDPDENGEVPVTDYVLMETSDGRVNFAPPWQLREILPKLQVGDLLRIKLVGEQQTKRGLNPVKIFTIKRKPAK